MKRTRTNLTLIKTACAACVLSFHFIVSAPAQPALDKMIFTLGTSIQNGQGGHWAYLLWQATTPELLNGRTFAIYQKAGDETAPGPYERKAVVGMTTDPTVIQVLLNRSVNLGENLPALETDVGSLFQSLMPPGGAQLKNKVAIVLLGGKNTPDHYKNLILLSRLHPGISLCLGFAHAQLLPGPGLYTFEVRAFDVAKDQDLAVTGRVTVNAGNPFMLPAPAPPVRLPDDPAHMVQGDLNARFRWGIGPDLRRVSLLNYGFNLYRMTEADAVSGNFHLNPPTPNQLKTLLQNTPPKAVRVNRLPILGSRTFDPGDAPGAAGDFISPISDLKTFFVADDNHRFDPGGTPHQNGDAFRYFAAARDILGRDGLVSAGSVEVTMCDRFPPDPPKGLAIENHYRYDPATKTSKQVLRAIWRQHVNTPAETVVKYHLYRWHSPTEMLAKQGQPLLNRIATLDHVNGWETNSIPDENLPGSPTLANDAGKTFWYTVRAEDNGACGGNLSGNSAPVFGVLRDRVGPAAPGGSILILCCRPETRTENPGTVVRASLDPDLAHFEVTVSSADTDAAYAEVYAFDPGRPSNLVARAFFAQNPRSAQAAFTIPRSTLGREPLSLHCVATVANGEQADAAVLEAVAVPSVGQVGTVGFTTSRPCRRVRLTDPVPGLLVPCRVHHPKPPGSSDKEPIELCFDLTPGTKEWRLYRRVDDGPMSLLKQGLADFNQANQICFPDLDYPVNPASLCYYVQLFDEHGNASALTLLGCFTLSGKKHKPMLTPLEPTGTAANPQMKVRWFCPPYGIERFQVHLSDTSFNPPQTISVEVSEKQGVSFELLPVDGFPFVRTYGVYKTPMAGPGFGQGAQFLFTAHIAKNIRYTVRVQAIGKDGLPGEFSNVEQLKWSETPPNYPEVPWPAHDLPTVSPLFAELNPGLQPVRLTVNPQHPIGIRIGQAQAASNSVEHPFALKTHADPVSYLYKGFFGRPLFPVALYRYQVPNAGFPTVSGDVTQVSPLMERIAYKEATDPQLGPITLVYDPFIVIYGPGALLSGPASIYLLDTQPVIEGARYGYLLVRLGLNKEISEVIPVGEVEVTP